MKVQQINRSWRHHQDASGRRGLRYAVADAERHSAAAEDSSGLLQVLFAQPAGSRDQSVERLRFDASLSGGCLSAAAPTGKTQVSRHHRRAATDLADAVRNA